MQARVLGLVPARGGSKGVPDKNVRPLAGRTLIDYVAAAARDSGVIDRLIVSTDSDVVAAVARLAGLEVPFMRPPDLGRDETPMLPVVQHAIGELDRAGWHAEIIVLLQPTSPLRTPLHIRESVQLLRESNADAVVSVVELPKHLSPDYVMRIEEGRLVSFLPDGMRVTRRQDARAAFLRDGTVYTFWSRTVREQHTIYGRHCRPLVVAAAESMTIDTWDDWHEAERRLAAAGRPPA